MNKLPWIILAAVLLLGGWLYIDSQSEIQMLREEVVSVGVRKQIEAREEVRRLQGEVDSLMVEIAASDELFLEYLRDIEQSEEELSEINERYETTLDSIRGLDLLELELFILDRLRHAND